MVKFDLIPRETDASDFARSCKSYIRRAALLRFRHQHNKTDLTGFMKLVSLWSGVLSVSPVRVHNDEMLIRISYRSYEYYAYPAEAHKIVSCYIT
jgi:hypothetical protein